MHLNDSLSISILFSYLLWNGYLSKDKMYCFNAKDRANIYNLFSLDIMTGNGVCLNTSDMLSDLLKVCDYQSAIIINKANRNIAINYRPDIKREKKNGRNLTIASLLVQPFGKLANHACSLIKDYDTFYVYDSTNLTMFNVKDKYNTTTIDNEPGIVLSPMFSYCIADSKESKSILDEFNTAKEFEDFCSKDEFIAQNENCLELFDSNNNLIEDFYDESRDNITNIAKFVKSNKGKKMRKRIK